MLSAQQVEEYIRQGLLCDYIKVHGDDGAHFEVLVVSPAFVGKSMVQQHQLVYAALGDKMRAEIHALSMKTLTTEAWASLRQDSLK
ncbi:MAG: BolA/IbaG family iron-sulfur metabolism protein [Betaproteobacteria bacterium]|nr:BolA/IbaG family iron-sulfur metabolism protein [Betaproteobacteria bacterium]